MSIANMAAHTTTDIKNIITTMGMDTVTLTSTTRV